MGWKSWVAAPGLSYVSAACWRGAGTALRLSCSIFTTTGPSDPCPAPPWLPGHCYHWAGRLISKQGSVDILLQVGTSTNQTSDAFYVTAYLWQSSSGSPHLGLCPSTAAQRGASGGSSTTQATPTSSFGPLNFPLKVATPGPGVILGLFWKLRPLPGTFPS